MKEDYDKLITISKLFENKDIKRVVQELLEGYKEKDDEELTFISSDNKSTMVLSEEDNKIILKIQKENLLEVISLKEGAISTKITYEKRPNGIIITKVDSISGYSKFSSEEKHITDMYSESYVLTDEILNSISPSLGDYQYLDKIYQNIDINIIKEKALLVTKFETHIRSAEPINKKNIEQLYANITYLNNEDVSYLYDEIKGTDMLLRIYDLYNGIINKRNIYDMHYINMGILRNQAFHLKLLKGITQKEYELVSNDMLISDYYKEYESLLKRISPSGYVTLDSREELLDSIRIRKCYKDEVVEKLDIETIIETLVPKPLNKTLKKIINVCRKTKNDK